jgi:DNA-binding IscR family transcriptional regulator
VDGAFAESSYTLAETRLGSGCAEGPRCGLKQVWRELQYAVEKILFATSFEEIKEPILRGGQRPRQLAQLDA